MENLRARLNLEHSELLSTQERLRAKEREIEAAESGMREREDAVARTMRACEDRLAGVCVYICVLVYVCGYIYIYILVSV